MDKDSAHDANASNLQEEVKSVVDSGKEGTTLNPIIKDNKKIMNKKGFHLVILASIFLVVVLGLITLSIYKNNFQKKIQIKDQKVTLSIHIDEVILDKDGFLTISRPESSSGNFAVLQHLKAGTYRNFDIFYSPEALNIDPSESSVSLRALVYEDTNLDNVFDYSSDTLVKDVFENPLMTKFAITLESSLISSCSDGVKEDFSDGVLENNFWTTTLNNKLEDGSLTQVVNGESFRSLNSTSVVSKNIYSGDMEASATISSFNVEPGGSATSELTLFTQTDRVIAVTVNKNAGESYLSYALSKNEAPVDVKHALDLNVPTILKLVRKGTDATVYVSQNGVEEKIWEIPSISTDDVYLDLETYPTSEGSFEASTSFSSASISCPAL